MPTINIPKDELDKATTPLLPVAWYKTLISNVEETETKEKKKKMYVFTHTITEGEHAGKKLMKWHVEPFGSFGPLLEFGLKKAKKEDGSFDVDPMECKGRSVQVHNSRGKNEKNGKDTNDIDDYRPIDYDMSKMS